MEFIGFVKKENVSRVEGALKSDFDTASKQSIIIKDAKTIGIDKSGSFFIISGSDEGVEKCKELIKEFIEEMPDEDRNKVKKYIEEEQDAAATGMGTILSLIHI